MPIPTQAILCVAIPSPLRSLFDYLPPTGLESDVALQLRPGIRVLVPFGNRRVVGVLIRSSNRTDVIPKKLRSVTDIIDWEPLFSTALLNSLLWAADYYQHPIGEVFSTALPASLRQQAQLNPTSYSWQITEKGMAIEIECLGRAYRQKSLLHLLREQSPLTAAQCKTAGFNIQLLQQLRDKKLVNRILQQPTKTAAFVFTEKIDPDKPRVNTEQQLAIKTIAGGLEKFHCFLLDGITGSGKTEAEFEHFKEVSTTLSQDAQNLTTALTGDSKQQGDWGEMILEKCLQNAGLIEGEHYQKQTQIKTDDGTQQRPDFIINLPNERIMIADSKVSLKAYNSYMSEEDNEKRKAHAKKHLQSVRNHIHGLSSKSYQEGFKEYGSPDYVLMFMQIESAYSLAQKLDNSLTSDAFNKNIIIVTPASLMMVVGIVNQLWRQEKQVQNVKDIFERGAKLYEKINGFLEDFVRIGDKLSDANVSYDNAYNKLSEGRGSMVRQAEMLKKLGLKTTRSIPREFKKSIEDSSE